MSSPARYRSSRSTPRGRRPARRPDARGRRLDRRGVPDRGRRLGPVDLRVPRGRHPQIVEFERDFRTRRSSCSSRTTARRRTSRRGERRHRQQLRPAGQELFTQVGAGDKIVGFTGYTGHDEAQFVATRSSACTRTAPTTATWRCSRPDELADPCTRGDLIRSAIPYRVLGGTKFYERREIKDAMAYLITVANPADPMALRRVLNVPKRGIGAVTETTLQRYADDHDVTMREALRHADELGFGRRSGERDHGVRRPARRGLGQGPGAAGRRHLTQLLDGSGPAGAAAEVARRAGLRPRGQHRRTRRRDARVPEEQPRRQPSATS